jgi:hypothetical protein
MNDKQKSAGSTAAAGKTYRRRRGKDRRSCRKR